MLGPISAESPSEGIASLGNLVPSSASANQFKTLRPDTVGTIGLLFQAMGQEAPIAIFAGSITGASAYALGATPLSFVFAMLAVLLAGSTIFQYSKRLTSAQGYYGYVTDGLGRYPGAFTSYMYVVYQIINVCFIILIYLWTFALSLNFVFGTNLPNSVGIPFVAIEAGAVFVTVYLGLRPSVIVLTALGLVESAVVIIFSLVFLAHSTPLSGAPFTQITPPGINAVFLGFITGSYFAYAGYGSIVPLGEEAKTPHKTIGRAVLYLILFISVIYLLGAYAQVEGWGIANMGSFASSGFPGAILAQQFIGLWAAAVVIILYNLVMFTPLVSMITALSRNFYAMGRDGLLSERFTRLSPRFRTPSTAIFVSAAVVTVLCVIWGAAFNAEYGFSNGIFYAWIIFLVISTLSTLTIHILANSALTATLRGRGVTGMRAMTHVLFPSVSSIIILVAIYYSVTSGLLWPAILGPILFGVIFLAIVAVVAVSRKRVRAMPAPPVRAEAAD